MIKYYKSDIQKIMEVKMKYEPLVIKVTRVCLEENLADTVCISTSAYLIDWEDGGELGPESEDGGDIFLML